MLDFLTTDRWQPAETALIDASSGETWSYARLRDMIDGLAERLETEAKAMALVLVRRDVPSLLAYLSALKAGQAVLPIEANLDAALLNGLVGRYTPELLLVGEADREAAEALELTGYSRAADLGGGVWAYRSASSSEPPHPDLSLLLSTSGSTGSPKLVRLTADNVLANGEQIREALRIDAEERAVTSLAFSYSFGLSVVHSHLLAGASLVVSDRNIMLRDFWNDVRDHEATSFSGVPYSYELIRRIGFERMELPSLRTLTQAGGKLGGDMIRYYHDLMDQRDGDFIVMYGQTEATARISVLPPELLPEKLGSVGFPLPGGSVEIRPLDGAAPGDVSSSGRETGELVYTGPNVMMGYAEQRADLARGDDQGGELATGDSGYVDEDGCLYITGRLKRFAKVMGLRVSLDEVEAKLQSAGAVAALDGDDHVVICCVPASEEAVRRGVLELSQRMKIHPRNFEVAVVEAFPQLPNGKIDYRTLGESVVP